MISICIYKYVPLKVRTGVLVTCRVVPRHRGLTNTWLTLLQLRTLAVQLVALFW